MAKTRRNPFKKLTGKPITKKRAAVKKSSQNKPLSSWDFIGLTTEEKQLLDDDYEERYLSGESSIYKPIVMDDQSEKENEYLYKQYLKSKTPTPRKTMKKKSTTTKPKSERQTGKSNLRRDEMKKAKLPGKRKSASGRTYYERRKNRSDTAAQRKAFSKKK